MEFTGRTFIDDVVYLDGNTFTNCTFDGCVIRYDGGAVAFTGTTRFNVENIFEWGCSVDMTHPFFRWMYACLKRASKQSAREPAPNRYL